MVIETISLFLAVNLLGAAAQENLPLIHTDSYLAYRTDAAFNFHCGKNLTRLSYVEHFRYGKEAKAQSLADRWRIELTGLSVDRRKIPKADLTRLRLLFRSFSWIERIRGTCAGNGDVSFSFSGMPAETWAAYGRSDNPRDRPELEPHTITVAATGAVTIR